MKFNLVKLIFVILVGVALFAVLDFNKEKDLPIYNIYNDDVFGVSFVPFSSLNDITLNSNYYICPEDDTYKTAESLPIYDKEIKWGVYVLPDSQSFISRVIRFKYLDVDGGEICGNDLLKKLASKEIVGEVLSSVQLNTIQIGDFYGVYNRNASRLNTAYIQQYTLFGNDKNGRQFVMQAYLSFVPYAESKELKEIEGVYNGDINEYIDKGQTSLIIRNQMDSFKNMLESMKKIF